jgi:hypothetical protein
VKRLLASLLGVSICALVLMVGDTSYAKSFDALSSTSSFIKSPLPVCDIPPQGRFVKVRVDVVAAVTKYYAKKKLTPIKVSFNRQRNLYVALQIVGVHWCHYRGYSTRENYLGFLPKGTIAAVQVQVLHKPYPLTGGAVHIVYLANLPKIGWKVVEEGTGP